MAWSGALSLQHHAFSLSQWPDGGVPHLVVFKMRMEEDDGAWQLS